MSESKSSKLLPIGCISAAVLAAIVIIGFFVLMIVAMAVGGANADGATGPTRDSIAHVDLEGVITSSQVASVFGGEGESMVTKFTKKMKKVRKNPKIKAVVVRINSPGGEVTASDVLYNQIKLTREKKPVVIYMDSVAASGGFYAACGGTEIMANPTTMTGSIGVIISTLRYKQLFEKTGMESVVFKSGKFKDTLSGTRDMRDDEKKLIQGMVDETYERFLGIVKEARKDIPEEKLRNRIADGRILSGAEALRLKLIDGNGYIDDAYDRARKLAKVPKAPVYHVKNKPSFFSALAGAQSKSIPDKIEIALPQPMGADLQPGMIYLLPPMFAH